MYLEEQIDCLNEQQKEAALWDGGSLLVLAGAGSGKTRVLATRIAWLIKKKEVSPYQIYAVTFTNKAAKEMVKRVECLVGASSRGAWIGTFHGLCHRMLRQHTEAAGLADGFDILDYGAQLSVVKRILKTMNLATDVFSPAMVCAQLNKAKQGLSRQKYWSDEDKVSRTMLTIYEQYEAICQQENVVDFAELILRCYELVAHNEPIRHHYQQKFRYIFVDEFQDTNALQYAWLKLLAQSPVAPTDIFAVGDDDQSIYSFRGANTNNMHLFIQECHVANVIRLEQNYRSNKNILEAANQVILKNQGRLGKQLWTHSQEGDLLTVLLAHNEEQEASWIAQSIQEIVAKKQYGYSDIVLLYRTNAQSRALEHALFVHGVPYQVWGGLRFFERAEIKNTLSYLRLLINPADNTALLRIINFPIRGIGDKTIEQLQKIAQEQNISLLDACSLLSGSKRRVLDQFVCLLQTLRDKMVSSSVAECVALVIEETGIQRFYQGEPDAQDRVANLQQLIVSAKNQVEELDQEFHAQSVLEQLSLFLAHVNLEAGEGGDASASDAIHLMTVHTAKGLEYSVVFLTGLEQGLFPNERSLHKIEDLEEERRLLYVAMTRARQQLYLTCAHVRFLYNHHHYHAPSQFLSEIPQNLLRICDMTAAKGLVPRGFPKPMNASTETSFSVGHRVQHAHFGQGVILAVQDQGKECHVYVSFLGGQKKWLMLSLANLTRLH